MFMQTNAEELRKGLPRKAREELPNNYNNALLRAYYAEYPTSMQGLSRRCRSDSGNPGSAFALGSVHLLSAFRLCGF